MRVFPVRIGYMLVKAIVLNGAADPSCPRENILFFWGGGGVGSRKRKRTKDILER